MQNICIKRARLSKFIFTGAKTDAGFGRYRGSFSEQRKFRLRGLIIAHGIPLKLCR